MVVTKYPTPVYIHTYSRRETAHGHHCRHCFNCNPQGTFTSLSLHFHQPHIAMYVSYWLPALMTDDAQTQRLRLQRSTGHSFVHSFARTTFQNPISSIVQSIFFHSLLLVLPCQRGGLSSFLFFSFFFVPCVGYGVGYGGGYGSVYPTLVIYCICCYYFFLTAAPEPYNSTEFPNYPILSYPILSYLHYTTSTE